MYDNSRSGRSWVANTAEQNGKQLSSRLKAKTNGDTCRPRGLQICSSLRNVHEFFGVRTTTAISQLVGFYITVERIIYTQLRQNLIHVC